MRRILAAAAVLVLIWFAVPARAATGRYVSLGDSFTAGPLIPGPHGSPPTCLRSDHNYPTLVSRAIGVRLTDVSCSGATTQDMTQPQHVPFGRNPPQLDAVTPDTTLVTLGIGGNDIGFTGTVLACATLSLTDPYGAPCASHFGDTLAKAITATGPAVGAVLDAIRQRAPGAHIVVVGYLRLLPSTGGCWPLVPYALGDVPFLDRTEQQLNAMLAAQASEHGVPYVGEYATGHDMCAPAGRKWVEGIFLTHPAFPVHPNAAGMRVVAGLVTAAVRSGQPR